MAERLRASTASSKLRGAKRAAVFLALLLYVVSFVVFLPRVLSVADEACYVRQAQALAEGRTTVESRDPLTGERVRVLPSTYPAGTSMLQVPFVWWAGWRGAAAASVLSLVITVLVLVRWLEGEEKSPLFALLVLGFVPALVMGRIAMSDVPSMAVATLAFFLFFRSNGESFGDWFLAGVFAGGSLLFRETNALLFVPLFAGAIVRRDQNWVALIVGGVLGGMLRPLTAFLVTGDPFFVRPAHLPLFYWENAIRNTALYLIALLVMVPGGLAAVLAYRGPRRVEIVATVLAYTAFYATYGYGAWESGWQKQMVLGPRFFLPLLPLLVVAIADVFPRVAARVSSPLLLRIANTITALWVVYVLVSVVLVHWVVDGWGRSQASIMRAFYDNTRPDAAVVVDPNSLSKYANEVYGNRTVLSWDDVPPDMIPRAFGIYGSVQVALLYRSDSDYWLQRGREGDTYIRQIASHCQLELVHDANHTATDRLRVWDIINCESPPDI